MITNGVPYQFGLGATFRRRDGEVVEWVKTNKHNLRDRVVFSDGYEREMEGMSPFHDEMNLTLVEQLTLPYDAEPIELAVGQVWEDNGRCGITRKIVFIHETAVAYIQRSTDSLQSYLNIMGTEIFKHNHLIPNPAVRPKKKVVTKLWVYNVRGQIRTARSEYSALTPAYGTECLGYIHGSEIEEVNE